VVLSPVPSRIPASQAQFLDDVGRTLRAWRTAPLLPVTVVAVACLTLLSGLDNRGVATLGGLLGLLLVGWPGAERLWYLRLWTGRTLSPGEAVRATLRCFGRFFVLALAVGSVGAVLAVPAIVGLVRSLDLTSDEPAFADVPTWVLVYFAVLTLLAYVLLTFVTPALVYSSKRLRDAVPIGLRLLRVSWPRTAAYVLVPAVLAGAPGFFLGFEETSSPNAFLTLLGALALSLGRGAVAAYYIRTVPGAGPDGAVRLEAQPGFYPPPATW
jgi:hypothetical protein